MTALNFFKHTPSNSFYSKEHRNYCKQNLLLTLENTVRDIMNYWLSTKENDHDVLLTRILNTSPWQHAEEVAALPLVIQQLLSDPCQIFSSIMDKGISSKDIQNVVYDVMQALAQQNKFRS